MRIGHSIGLVALAALAACAEAETTVLVVGPTGNPSMAVVEPQAPEGRDGEPACVKVTAYPRLRVPLLVETEELTLRPPGACGLVEQCGSLRLYANGELNSESAVPAIELRLDELSSPFFDGHEDAETGQPDVLSVRVEVVDDGGEPFLDDQGEPLEDSLTLVTKLSCD